MDSFHARATRTKPVAKARRDERHPGAQRVDALLLAKGLAASRTAAQKLIKAGRVSWQQGGRTHKVSKPSEVCPEGAHLILDCGADIEGIPNEQDREFQS